MQTYQSIRKSWYIQNRFVQARKAFPSHVCLRFLLASPAVPYCRSTSSQSSQEPSPSSLYSPPAQRSVPYIVSGRRPRSCTGFLPTTPQSGQQESEPACASLLTPDLAGSSPGVEPGGKSSAPCCNGNGTSDTTICLSPVVPLVACHPSSVPAAAQLNGRTSQPLGESDATVLSLSDRFRNMKSTVQQRLAFGKQAES